MENNYKGKTAKEIWNEWTVDQRWHFIDDHADAWEEKISDFDLPSTDQDYEKLHPLVKEQIRHHKNHGSYKKGGLIAWLNQKVF